MIFKRIKQNRANKSSTINPKKILFDIGIVVMFLSIATGIGYLFEYIGFAETNIVIVYLLAVLATASLTKGYAYGIVTAVAATFAFNFFFTVPLYTFAVDDPGYIVTFAVMTVTSVVTSTLTTKIKQNAENARMKAEEAKALYSLTNRLTDAKDIDDIANIGVKTISEIFNCNTAILFFGEPALYIMQTNDTQKHAEIDGVDELKKKAEMDINGDNDSEEFHDYSIYGRENVYGLLRIPKDTALTLSDVRKKLLHSMIENLSLATESYYSRESKIKSREEAEKEKYRSNLLRAISHDIRTPLAGIMGTSEMLVNMTADGEEKKLAQEINSDADWLNSLVENILSLTKMRDSGIRIEKQLEAMEEVVGSAVARIKKRYPLCNITVTVPEHLVLIPMDVKLMEQVMLNLLDNAVKFAGEQSEISVGLVINENSAEVNVMDNGPGLKQKDLPNLFKLFYKGKTDVAVNKKGVGLGLTICETIIAAHGGTITAENNKKARGAIFRFTLPLEVKNA